MFITDLERDTLRESTIDLQEGFNQRRRQRDASQISAGVLG